MSKCLLKINKQAFIDAEERQINRTMRIEDEETQKEEFIIDNNNDNDNISIDEETKQCRCGSKAIVREVKKDGPNKGKLFYCCQQSYDKKCDYFMWKEDKVNPVINSANAVLDNNDNNENVKSDKYCKQQQKLGLMCNCKLPSVLREVKKDGPNKGKMFYTCSKNFDDKCKYFVWK